MQAANNGASGSRDYEIGSIRHDLNVYIENFRAYLTRISEDSEDTQGNTDNNINSSGHAQMGRGDSSSDTNTRRLGGLVRLRTPTHSAHMLNAH